jgi:ubiquinone/menaquinone biosynthesis C-methylase UbiE
MTTETLNVEAAVRERYSQAAQVRQESLCCAVAYDRQYLEVIPQEIIDRDYGCGDPSKHVRAGEVVLDLGSGGGKICYIAAQVVGPAGFVIGVDCNDDMLGLARQHRQAVGDRLGYHNVEFRKGRIQDLALNLELLDEHLTANPIRDVRDWLRFEEHAHLLRDTRPLVADDAVDVVVSNCVLNLVNRGDRSRLFAEIHRVLKPGGRAVISDIVSSRDVPRELQANPELWSGCVSGAFREDRFLAAFADAGFHPVELIERQAEAWQTIDGLEFRSVTVRATKPQTNGNHDGAAAGLNVLPVTMPLAAGSCCGPTGCC